MEFRKLFQKNKIIMVLLVLFVCQVFFYIYSGNSSVSENSETEFVSDFLNAEDNEQNSFDYNEYVEQVVNQADYMSTISIFNREDSFANSNIEKTKSDYIPLLNVSAVSFDDSFLTVFFSFGIINGIIILCGIIVPFVYVDENSPGLRGMLFASINGRGKLALRRIGAIALWDGIITAVFYIATLIISILMYGGDLYACLSYPVQSIYMFRDFTLCINIGEFILIYILFRFFIMFAVSILVWTLLFCVDNLVISGGIVVIIGFVSYILKKMISANSPANLLRYCNFWYLSSGAEFFTEYRNLNIFGNAVNKNVMSLIFCGLVISICVVIGLIVGIKRYPCKSRLGFIGVFMKKIRTSMGKFAGKIQEGLSVTAAEYYKMLISQKGILVLLILGIVFFRNTDFTLIQKSGALELYYSFMDEHTGSPDEASENEIQRVAELVEYEKNVYEAACIAYEAGEMDDYDWMVYSIRYESFENERLFLDKIQSQKAYLDELSSSSGINGWYINENSYNNLINSGNTVVDMLVIFSIIIMCSGIFSYENKRGMTDVLRCGAKGRNGLFWRKIGMAFVIVSLIYFVQSGLAIGENVKVYGMSGLTAPVQSIESLSFVPFHCSIGMFLVIVYLIRYVMVLLTAIYTCMFSARVSQKAAIGLGITLMVPACLAILGFKIFRYLSVVEILSVMPYMLQTRSVAFVGISAVVLTVFGTISLWAGHKKWCVS